MADYDIGEAFQKIEEEMINSMIRNMKHHIDLEAKEGLNYNQWQAEQLAALAEYRKANKKAFSKYFSTINTQIETALKQCYKNGGMDTEAAILEAIKKGFTPMRSPKGTGITGDFFKINQRKLNALITETVKDMSKAETAVLRMANDQYRKVIYNAQVYYNTGAGTLEQCVDMATKDYLSAGINCIQYANGARVSIDSYAKMALRTATTRAYLQGEAAKRDEWGVNTVIVNKRGVACPMCLQWVGRVYYDDVWGNVPVTDKKYPLLSEAIQGGLYHPNCKDSHTTYFEGINPPPEPMTQAQKDEAARVYDLEQKQRYYERTVRKYKRLRDGSTDEKNKSYYSQKVADWQEKTNEFVKQNGDVLKRRYENEQIRGIIGFAKPPTPVITPIKPPVVKPKPVKPKPAPEPKPVVVNVPTITPGEFTAEFTATARVKNQTKLFVDKMNAAEGRNGKIVALFKNMRNNDRVSAENVPFNISYTEDKHALNYRYKRLSGDLTELNLKIPKLSKDSADGFGTVCHEEGHYLDMLHGTGHTGFSETFAPLRSAIDAEKSGATIGKNAQNIFSEFETECKKIDDAMSKKYKAIRDDLYSQVHTGKIGYKDYKKRWNRAWTDQQLEGDALRRAVNGGHVSALEDIYDALSGGAFLDSSKIRYGHGIKYYGSDPGCAPSEIWANYVQLSINRPDLIDVLRADKPEVVKALEEMTEELLKRG